MFTNPDMTRYNIILLRHGESIGNQQGYYQGQSEYDLTEKGRRQAEALAKRWLYENLHLDAAISSPQSRARQTAEIISGKMNMQLEFDDNWMERDNGVLAGLRPKEALETYPPPDFTHPFLPVGRHGESQWELYLRAGQAVQTLLRRPPGSYLVVSHGGLLNMALYVILGITVQANFSGPRFLFRNVAFARLSYQPAQHVWRLETFNDGEHLKGLESIDS